MHFEQKNPPGNLKFTPWEAGSVDHPLLRITSLIDQLHDLFLVNNDKRLTFLLIGKISKNLDDVEVPCIYCTTNDNSLYQ